MGHIKATIRIIIGSTGLLVLEISYKGNNIIGYTGRENMCRKTFNRVARILGF